MGDSDLVQTIVTFGFALILILYFFPFDLFLNAKTFFILTFTSVFFVPVFLVYLSKFWNTSRILSIYAKVCYVVAVFSIIFSTLRFIYDTIQ